MKLSKQKPHTKPHLTNPHPPQSKQKKPNPPPPPQQLPTKQIKNSAIYKELQIKLISMTQKHESEIHKLKIFRETKDKEIGVLEKRVGAKVREVSKVRGRCQELEREIKREEEEMIENQLEMEGGRERDRETERGSEPSSSYYSSKTKNLTPSSQYFN